MMSSEYHARSCWCWRFGLVAAILSGCSGRTGSPGKSAEAIPAAAPPGSHAGHNHETAPAAAHDPDDVPITEADVELPKDYAAFVARVEQLTLDIRDKLRAGMPTKAHRSLDELDILLRKAPEIASNSGVPKTHWKEVNLRSKELAATHNELHEVIDAGATPDYNTVADRIEQAIDALKAVSAGEDQGRSGTEPADL
jgi:hypothetical protein